MNLFQRFLLQKKLRYYQKVVGDIQDAIEDLNFSLENQLSLEETREIISARHNLHEAISVILTILALHGVHWDLRKSSGEPYVNLD